MPTRNRGRRKRTRETPVLIMNGLLRDNFIIGREEGKRAKLLLLLWLFGYRVMRSNENESTMDKLLAAYFSEHKESG